MPTTSATSLIVIRCYHFLHCFNIYISCWHALVTRSWWWYLLGLPYNRLYQNWTCVLLIVHSPNATVNISNILPRTFNFIFYIKLNTISLIHFFRIIKNRRAFQNTTNLFICQKTNWQFKMADIVNIYNRHVYQHNTMFRQAFLFSQYSFIYVQYFKCSNT